MEDNDEFSVSRFSHKLWQEVYHLVNGGVVFIEDCLAECLHWEGGIFNLMDAGALGVKCLSPFENGTKDQKKAVFITRGTNNNFNTIKEILSNSSFIYGILIITVPMDVVSSECNGITLAELKNKIISWIGYKKHALEILFHPIFAVSISNGIFTTPVYSEVFPKFGDNLHPKNPTSVDLHTLPLEDKNEVRRLVSNLNSLLGHMNAKEDIYFMGMYSSILAGVLEHLPEAAKRRKLANKNVSVILVDRTIDLSGVTSHSSESLLDKMINILPRFPGHSVDVAVDMSPLCESKVYSPVDDIHLCAGCVSHPNNKQSIELLSQLINHKQSDVMLSLYTKLSAIATSTPMQPPTRITTQNLDRIITNMKGNYDLIGKHSEFLQQTLGVVQTLKSPKIRDINLLTSIEKQILQSLSTSKDSTSVLTQISNIIKLRKQHGLSLERLLCLLVYMYSVAGCDVAFSNVQEKQLCESLRNALFEDREEISVILKENDIVQTEEGCDTLASQIVKRLKDVSTARQLLVSYKSVIKVTDEISPIEYKGVLQQLIYDMVDVEKPNMPDLKSRTEGLNVFLNALMKTASKMNTNMLRHPNDNPLVILFIVGGTTAEECRKLHQAVNTSGTNTNILIGSTAITNPVETMKRVLFL